MLYIAEKVFEMSRVIKFRMPIISAGKFLEWFYWGFCGELEGEFISPHSNYRNCPSYQYTGFLDMNGHEIYEGDIIRIQLPVGGFWGNVVRESIGYVEFDSDYGSCVVKWRYSYSKNLHHEILNCDIAHGSIVLGNIYENTEILKQK